MKRTHPYCGDINCKTCYDEHMELMLRLERESGRDDIDHLSKYRSWLERDGWSSETETGWAKPEAFEESNINKYLARFKEES